MVQLCKLLLEKLGAPQAPNNVLILAITYLHDRRSRFEAFQ